MIRITCINKDNGDHYDQYKAITHLGWTEDGTANKGRATLAQIVAWLEKGVKAYTQDAYGNRAYLGVRTSAAGNKFVQTYADEKWNNNLLALNECPIV